VRKFDLFIKLPNPSLGNVLDLRSLRFFQRATAYWKWHTRLNIYTQLKLLTDRKRRNAWIANIYLTRSYSIQCIVVCCVWSYPPHHQGKIIPEYLIYFEYPILYPSCFGSHRNLAYFCVSFTFSPIDSTN